LETDVVSVFHDFPDGSLSSVRVPQVAARGARMLHRDGGLFDESVVMNGTGSYTGRGR